MKYAFFILLFIFSNTLHAICPARFYFLYDDSPSASAWRPEAQLIVNTLNTLTGGTGTINVGDNNTMETINNFNIVRFSRFHANYEGSNPNNDPYNSGAGTDGFYGNYSPIRSALRAAHQDCQKSCNNTANYELGRLSKCVFLYWTDNIIMHPNPAITMFEVTHLPHVIKTIEETGHVFVDLSFDVNSPTAEIDAISDSMKRYARQFTFGNVDFRNGNYTTQMDQKEIDDMLVTLIDYINHTE